LKTLDLLQEFNFSTVSNVNELKLKWQEYIENYPELHSKLMQNIIEDTISDETLMKEVFIPAYNNLNKIKEAYNNCLTVIKELESTFSLYYHDEFQIVLYFGNGSGAGWYTKYLNEPSILLGFENIIILNWITKESLRALIAHEFGHMVHTFYCDKKEVKENLAISTIFSEGYAQYIESKIINTNFFVELEEGNKNLGKWFAKNKKNIAKEYLVRIEKNQEVKDFFSSWLRWKEYRQVGYFLGYYIISEIAKKYSYIEIGEMKYPEYSKEVKNILTTAST